MNICLALEIFPLKADACVNKWGNSTVRNAAG